VVEVGGPCPGPGADEKQAGITEAAILSLGGREEAHLQDGTAGAQNLLYFVSSSRSRARAHRGAKRRRRGGVGRSLPAAAAAGGGGGGGVVVVRRM